MMTIRVTITNLDATRSIEVQCEDVERETGRRTRDSYNTRVLKPGETGEFVVHLLKDVIVREIEP
jgi:uncharacterized cupredoxin-like copper-binding protein